MNFWLLIPLAVTIGAIISVARIMREPRVRFGGLTIVWHLIVATIIVLVVWLVYFIIN